jgi:hypothetical protein
MPTCLTYQRYKLSTSDYRISVLIKLEAIAVGQKYAINLRDGQGFCTDCLRHYHGNPWERCCQVEVEITPWEVLGGQSRANHRGVIKLGQQI